MNELHLILRKEKNSRGYINFDLDEAKIVQDENGKAIDVVKRIREEGEMLIEDLYVLEPSESVYHFADVVAVNRPEIPESKGLEEVSAGIGDESGLGFADHSLHPVPEPSCPQTFPDMGLYLVVGRIGSDLEQI